MITLLIAAAIVLPIALVAAVIFVRNGIAREEADRSMLGQPTSRVAAATRRLTGLYVRSPRLTDDPGDPE